MSAPPERVLADGVEDDVVRLAVLREILTLVVDDDVGAERPHEVDVLPVAHGGHLGAEVLRELHAGGADGAGGAVDDDASSLQRLSLSQACEGDDRSVADRPASSKLMPAGLCASAPCSRTQMYSAFAPPLIPNTSSPASNSVTAAPTSSTTPASSIPGVRRFGLVSPVKTREKKGSAARKPQSERVTDVA